MRKEAHLVENEHVKGEWQSEIVYAQLEGEWPSRRPAGGAGSAAELGGTSARVVSDLLPLPVARASSLLLGRCAPEG